MGRRPEPTDHRGVIRLRVLLGIAAGLLVVGAVVARAGATRGWLARLGESAAGQRPRRVLRVWDWWAPSAAEAYGRYFAALEREFEQAHPDVDVQYQFVPFSQYEQKMATALVGHSPPDVFQSSVSWAEGFYDRGMLLPLDGFLAREREERERRQRAGLPVDPGEVVEKEVFLEPAWRHNTKPDGTVFGIPQILDSSAMLWNLDLLQEAAQGDTEIRDLFVRRADGSVDWERMRPDAIRDWEQFRWVMKKLTRYGPDGHQLMGPNGDPVQTGFYLQAYGSGAGPFDPWLTADGGHFQDPEGTRALFAEPPGVEAMQFIADLYWKDRVCPPFRRQLTDQETFEQRRAACVVSGTWAGKYIVRDTEGWKHFALSPFPPGPRGKHPNTLSWGNMLVITRRCPDPELAWQYIRFVTSLRGALRLLKYIEQNSPRKDFYETGAWNAATERLPYLTNIPVICASGEKLRHTQINAVDDQVKPLFETILLHAPEIEAGRGPYPTLAAGLTDAAQRVDRVYQRYNTQVASWRARASHSAPDNGQDRQDREEHRED